MKQQELYTHTRNYGCRYKLYTQNGVEMLSLENAKIKVEIAGNSDKAFSCDIVKAQIVKYLKRYNLKAFVEVEQDYEQNTLICTVYKINTKGL